MTGKSGFIKIFFLTACILIAVLFLSCGLEDYYYIDQVPQTRIQVELNNKATITLSSLSSIYYASYYTIYYRIYISGLQESGEIQTSSAVLSGVNPALSSDYNALYRYTDPTDTSTSTNIGTQFNNRNYYEIQLQGGNIRNLLDRNFSGRVVIEFPAVAGQIPTLTAGTSIYPLLRSDGERNFSPLPDHKYFLNAPELNYNGNAISTINADTAANSGWSDGQQPRYTYISLYIVAVGLDDRTFATIYSKPTHIGILRLPDPS